jgi:Putative peptidoglycan binding domain
MLWAKLVIYENDYRNSLGTGKKTNSMRFIKNLVAGLLLTGALAMLPDTSFARGGGGGHSGGGGGHFAGGGHFGGFHSGFAGRGFAQRGHFNGAWRHGGYGFAHGYGGYYGYYGPYDYGDYGDFYPYDYGSYNVQPATSYTVTEDPAALITSVQKELAQLGYYHGPIDGIAGSETERAVRWFQSVDKLPVTGQIDSATVKALQIG